MLQKTTPECPLELGLTIPRQSVLWVPLMSNLADSNVKLLLIGGVGLVIGLSISSVAYFLKLNAKAETLAKSRRAAKNACENAEAATVTDKTRAAGA